MATATEPQAYTKSELLDMSNKDIMTAIRAALKEEIKECKFSVRKETYSMGWTIHISLMSAPFGVFEDSKEYNVPQSGYAQMNEYQLRRDNVPTREQWICNAVVLTPYGWHVMKKAAEIADRYNWNNSDMMSDYYDVNFSLMLSIGQWDKPFQVRG